MKGMARISIGVAALVLTAAAAATARADAIRVGQFDGNTLASNDDDSTDAVGLGFSLNFYGASYSSVYVNNNGNATFDSPLATWTPFGITGGTTPMLAPFFGDVDTRDDPDVGLVINDVTYGTGSVGGRSAFGVNWIDVGYWNYRNNLLNSFQLVIIDRSDVAAGDFDFEFNIGQIQWETGEASGGIDGLGGESAHVGWTNGIGTYYEFAGSGVPGSFLDGSPGALVDHSLNSDVAGRYLFQVRGGEVTSVVTPLPTAAFTALPLLAGMAVLGLRRARRAVA